MPSLAEQNYSAKTDREQFRKGTARAVSELQHTQAGLLAQSVFSAAGLLARVFSRPVPLACSVCPQAF